MSSCAETSGIISLRLNSVAFMANPLVLAKVQSASLFIFSRARSTVHEGFIKFNSNLKFYNSLNSFFGEIRKTASEK